MTNKSGPILYSMGSALDLVQDLPLFQREPGKAPRKPSPAEEQVIVIDPALKVQDLCQPGTVLYIGVDGMGDSTHPTKAECFEAWSFIPDRPRTTKPSIFEPVHRVSPELGILHIPGEEVMPGFYNNLRGRDKDALLSFIMHLHRTPDRDLYRVRALVKSKVSKDG